MIKQLLVVCLAICGMIAIAALRTPDRFRVERSITIAAPPTTVFPLVNDFRNFGLWSPWEKLDPAMERSIAGAATGVGATYRWSGNGKAGAGRMEIKESTPVTRVITEIAFTKPIASTNLAEYTFTPVGDSTRVTWAMSGASPFVSKLMQVFVTMDDQIGGDFERGLAALKAVAEK